MSALIIFINKLNSNTTDENKPIGRLWLSLDAGSCHTIPSHLLQQCLCAAIESPNVR